MDQGRRIEDVGRRPGEENLEEIFEGEASVCSSNFEEHSWNETQEAEEGF